MANPKRPVALLDVDGTLLFGSEDNISYNNNLIDTLIENKVTDVYLFTSMTLKTKSITERAKLVDHLKSKGLTVHGVICSADLIWNKDKQLINEFYEDLEANTLDLEDEKYSSLIDFTDAIPGQGYADVTAEVNNAWTNEDAERYQTVSLNINKYLDKQDDSIYAKQIAQSEKAHLYQMFVNNKPEWAGDVIFAEDANNHIDGVLAMHNKLAPEHRLLTVYNKPKKENPKPFYQKLIEPFVKLLNLFNTYALERIFSYNSEKNEILERFKQELENCVDSSDLQLVLFEYKALHYQKLNTHRFSFWSEEKTRSATVFDEMYEARLNQISPPLIDI